MEKTNGPEGDAPAPSAPLASDAWRRPLTLALAMRIGPIAPIIVNREAAAVATLAELIERLAETIPSLRERAEFRIEAAKLLPRSKSQGGTAPDGPSGKRAGPA